MTNTDKIWNCYFSIIILQVKTQFSVIWRVTRSGLLVNFLGEEVGKKTLCPTNNVIEITKLTPYGDAREILINTTHKETY